MPLVVFGVFFPAEAIIVLPTDVLDTVLLLLRPYVFCVFRTRFCHLSAGLSDVSCSDLLLAMIVSILTIWNKMTSTNVLASSYFFN